MDSVPDDNLRVSNADRTDVALAARTRGELRVVLADLPDMDSEAKPLRRVSSPPEQLGGWMTSIERRGPWTVVPVLNLNTRMCTTTLDFTSAGLPGPATHHAPISCT